MLKTLLESARPHSIPLGSLVASVGVHLVLGVPAWNGVVRAGEEVRPESFITRALFVPPPDRTAASRGTVERIGWVKLPGASETDFISDAPLPERLPSSESFGRDALQALKRAVVADAAAAVPGMDTAYSILEVDEQAVRSDASDAPLYPNDLLAEFVEGSVAMRYVVSTAGSIDTASAIVLRSTHPHFTNAVRAALGRMRFVPAKVNDRPVSQLVEQEFHFRIRRPAASADSTSGAATRH